MDSAKKNERTMNLPDFPALEKDILARWKEHDIFHKTLEATKNGKRFVFFEGPPTANGKPGIHHVLARAFKDVIPRFKTMQGFFVERKAGWDTHGLPVELSVEKKLGLKSKKEIEAYGIAKFNEECHKSVWQYKEDWEQLTERIGFWLDMEHPYITYEKDYVESLWWILKQIWDKQLLYQGHKVVPHCPRCGTALSSHEVAQGYETVKDTSVYVRFRVRSNDEEWGNTSILSWTTTPWTLPGNVALAVNANEEYVCVPDPDQKGHWLVLGKIPFQRLIEQGLFPQEYAELKPPQIDVMRGSELVDIEYEPLFDFLDLGKLTGKKAYYITDADFVTTDEGTGVVHTAVMYGEDDYKLGEKIDLPKHHTVNEDGTFTDDVGPFAGMFVKDPKTEKAIVEYLQSRGLLHKVEEYSHDYPFCWRCHSPLLYYAKNSWFIKMSSLRQQLNDNNQQINWVPDNIKEGRFGEWLKDVKDWAISRERYWGTPLPIWECQHTGCHNKVCIGSFAELFEKATVPLDEKFDPHRPFVDDIRICCPKCNREMQRIKELCDVWFDSGAMPFAQWHYPFENAERIDDGVSYPAEYISEAIDQTRGWFYTLLAVSTLLGREAPYKNVICLGHILDVKGKKMSKHLGNVVDPWEVIDQYGADALRFHLFTVNQPGEPKLFDQRGVADVVRKHFLILWNVVLFWELTKNTAPTPKPSSHVLDRWLAARTTQLVGMVTAALESYDVTGAARNVSVFITDLSTWYVRRSRSRFRTPGPDRDAAHAALSVTLDTLARLLAPFTPFLAELVYRRVGGSKSSVHLVAWPTENELSATMKEELITMENVQMIVELGHAAREKAGIRLRQPLPQVVVVGVALDDAHRAIVQEELNVRDVVAAKRLPTHKDWITATNGTVSLALDTTITDELLHEGWMREIVRHVNDLRKQAGLTPADRITVVYSANDEQVMGVLEHYRTHIQDVVKADALVAAHPEEAQQTKQFNLGTGRMLVGITKSKAKTKNQKSKRGSDDPA